MTTGRDIQRLDSEAPGGSSTPQGNPRVAFADDGRESPAPPEFLAQYAAYPNSLGKHLFSEASSEDAQSEKRSATGPTLSQPADNQQPWVPLFLQRWFWVSYVILLVGLAVGLEAAYAVGKRRLGWDARVGFFRVEDYLNYVISLPPVIVAMIIVAVWISTDAEIKKLQPYVDLIHGNAPAHRSLLLNYARYSNFFVWFNAAANRHTLVFLTTIMALLALTFQPLASALLEIRDTYIPEGARNVTNTRALGLHQDDQFQDLTYFLAATNFAAASVLFQLPDPAFIYQNYAIAPFNIPHEVAANGSVHATTFAVRSDPNCVAMDPVKVQRADGTGWDVTGTYEECTMSWSVDKNTTTLFGTGVPSCPTGPHANVTPGLLPVIFWFFTYKPEALASATFCNPQISLQKVNVTVDLASSNITSLVELGAPISTPPGLSFLPKGYNGIAFDHLPANPDRFVTGRMDAIQLQMPSAMLEAAAQSSAGVVSFFQSNSFVGLSQKIYITYLNLIAKSVYFAPIEDTLTTQIWAWRKRVWLSNVATHLLTAGLLILAIIATFVHIQHGKARRDLILYHEPGTIASAVSFGAQTGMGALLAREAPQSDRQFEEVLKDKKFRIDPVSRRILMEGEEGYETATTPRTAELMSRRKSVFAAFQRQKLGDEPPTPAV